MKQEEPFFIINDFVEKNKQELEKILDIVKPGKIKHYERAVFIRNLTNEMFKTYTRKRKFIHTTKTKEEILNKKRELEQKKLELLKKLKQLEIGKKTKEEIQTVITSKQTNKPLVTANFDGYKYIIKEPIITQEQNKILQTFRNIGMRELNDTETFKTAVENECRKQEIQCTGELIDTMRYYLIRDKQNLGVISPILEDTRVKEIICDGTGKPVHVTYQDKPDTVTNINYKSSEEINEVIKKVAEKNDITLTKENPFIKTEYKNWEFQGNLKTEFIEPKFIFARK